MGSGHDGWSRRPANENFLRDFGISVGVFVVLVAGLYGAACLIDWFVRWLI